MVELAVPGKVYASKASGFQVLIRSRAEIYHPQTGVQIDEVPRLTADFGAHGGEFTYEDPLTGRIERGAFINGGFFDSAAAAEQNNWTDDEHVSAIAVLDRLCEKMPEYIWVHSKPAAEKPWPRYDDTHHNQIPTLAEQLGLVGEALAYEAENKNRESVIVKLREIIDRDRQAEELTAA